MDKPRFNAVMLWYNEKELGISNDWDKFHCKHIIRFSDPKMALDFYANTPCPASQLINAYSQEELDEKIQDMFEKFDHDKNFHKYLHEIL